MSRGVYGSGPHQFDGPESSGRAATAMPLDPIISDPVTPGRGTLNDGLATGGVVSREAAEEVGRSIGQYGCVMRPNDGKASDG